MQADPWSPSGLQVAPTLQWGSHLLHFYSSGDELRDLLVPYFKAGLDNNERCLWVAGAAFDAEHARAALLADVPNLPELERSGQIEIVDATDWYSTNEDLDPADMVDGLLKLEQEALAQGFAGLRTNGNCAWVPTDRWADFQDYELGVQDVVRNRRMICMCSYDADRLHDRAHRQVMECHDMVIPAARRSPPDPAPDGYSSDLVDPGELRLALDRQKRTFDLAMTASQMGTWRYTLADNICVYDENAQRLYGLTEAKFLHDAGGVEAKFHPDDMELMWARVAAALAPGGDGRYDVEYRVKQLDGSWRWLSAWGIVEFEGDGLDRKPVAIAGASRDLTERKQAEELQRLLLNELNHRVKNTLATIQAISSQTLKSSEDLPSAQQALDQRIVAMAKAHDLLTSRAWQGANVRHVVGRALDPFSPTQLTLSGDNADVSSRHALALSMALHELATNASKHGALSTETGHVSVTWRVAEGTLRLDWRETGGPPVAQPSRKGFGSLLLERLLVRDLGGEVALVYDEAGLRFSFEAKL
jgi:PAS domain S-box-containing protein